MISSKCEFPTGQQRSSRLAQWNSTLAFVKDQLLQFWPPYRPEIPDPRQDPNGDPSAGKSEKPATPPP